MKPSLSNLDSVMKGFFQAQMPKVWPNSPIPAELASPVATRSSNRNRLTLAVSVAALLGLGFVLSYSPTGGSNTPSDSLMKDSTANGKNLVEPKPIRNTQP